MASRIDAMLPMNDAHAPLTLCCVDAASSSGATHASVVQSAAHFCRCRCDITGLPAGVRQRRVRNSVAVLCGAWLRSLAVLAQSPYFCVPLTRFPCAIRLLRQPVWACCLPDMLLLRARAARACHTVEHGLMVCWCATDQKFWPARRQHLALNHPLAGFIK